MLQYSKPSVLFCPFIYLFLRRVWLFSLGSPVKNQLFLLHIMTHRGKHAYRFAVFVFLQRAHHWAAFLLESDLSASAHFHSLLCRRKNIAKSLVFIFFSPKNYRKHSSYTLCYTCPAIICLSPISLPGKRESAVGAVPVLMQFPLTTFGVSPLYVSTSPLHHTMHRLPLKYQYNLHLSNSICKYPHWNTVLKPQT